LLDPGEKAAYDAKLRATLSGPEEIRRPDPLADLFADIPESGPPVVLSPIRRQRRLPQPALVGAGVAIGLLILLGLVVWGFRSPTAPQVTGPEEAGPTKTSSTTEKQTTGEPAKAPQPQIPVSTTAGPPEVAKATVTAPIAPPPAPVPPPPLAVAPFSDAEAKEHQRRWGEYLKVPVETTNSIGMKLVLIPPGKFMMGNNTAASDEGPAHDVTITTGFYVGKYEVTQAQWQAVMGNNPSQFKESGPDAPVEQVSWNEAVAFCNRLSAVPPEKEIEGAYRLPTEAEWEYSARAGTTIAYCFGDEKAGLSDFAWWDGNSHKKTHPIGQKRPNGFGLFDVHGNVWEWCADWHAKDYYQQTPVTDPAGPLLGSVRVIRGGSWADSDYLRRGGTGLPVLFPSGAWSIALRGTSPRHSLPDTQPIGKAETGPAAARESWADRHRQPLPRRHTTARSTTANPAATCTVPVALD